MNLDINKMSNSEKQDNSDHIEDNIAMVVDNSNSSEKANSSLNSKGEK